MFGSKKPKPFHEVLDIDLDSPRAKELFGGHWFQIVDGGKVREAYFGKFAWDMFAWKLSAIQDRDRRIRQLEEELRRARDLRDLLIQPGADR